MSCKNVSFKFKGSDFLNSITFNKDILHIIYTQEEPSGDFKGTVIVDLFCQIESYKSVSILNFPPESNSDKYLFRGDVSIFK